MIVDRFMPETEGSSRSIAELFVLGFQFVLFYYGWLLTRKMGDETAISLVVGKNGLGLQRAADHRRPHAPDQRPASAASYLGQSNRKGADAAWSGSSSE